MSRTRIDADIFPHVDDWADLGDLYYGEMNEDGERPILRPDHALTLVVSVRGGELFTFNGFLATEGEAEEMLARVVAAGSINEEKWSFLRVCYGSEAYINGGYEAERAAAEREEARNEALYGRW